MAGLSPTTLTYIKRGLRHRCPGCGVGPLFHRYLKPVAACAACGEPLAQLRADDFPPYLTIIIVGHLVVPLMLLCEHVGFSTSTQVAFWVPMTLLLTLLLLPRCKGAVIGLMWSLRMSEQGGR